MSLGLYLHIPYCFSKCRYCDFYSHPGERGVPDAYVDALLRELHRFAPDTAAFLQDAAAPIMDGSCGAEDYLILQLRLRKGLDLEAYKTLYGKQFSTAQLAFVQNCVRAGYATFDGRILALTPAGLIVQNSILAQLL